MRRGAWEQAVGSVVEPLIVSEGCAHEDVVEVTGAGGAQGELFALRDGGACQQDQQRSRGNPAPAPGIRELSHVPGMVCPPGPSVKRRTQTHMVGHKYGQGRRALVIFKAACTSSYP